MVDRSRERDARAKEIEISSISFGKSILYHPLSISYAHYAKQQDQQTSEAEGHCIAVAYVRSVSIEGVTHYSVLLSGLPTQSSQP